MRCPECNGENVGHLNLSTRVYYYCFDCGKRWYEDLDEEQINGKRN